MALVDDTIPNLMNGVSQQAISLRQSSQAEVQINGFSSIVDGVGKRPPTRTIAKIIDGVVGNSYVHTINRDRAERYEVITLDGQIKVYDMTGVEVPVSYPNGVSYISTANPEEDIRMVTVADNTFVVNRATKVLEAADVSPTNVAEGLVFVRRAEFEGRYYVDVDGVEYADYTLPGTSGSISIDLVATNLLQQLQANLPAGFTATGQSPLVRIEKDDGTNFELSVRDSEGNSLANAIKGEVQTFSDLPASSYNGFVVSVVGDEDSSADNYYVKFQTSSDADFGEGVWEETRAPGVPFKLDNATMPHTLRRLPDGTFEFAQASWGERIVGDIESAPWPSFVGDTINDVYFDRNRFCVLSKDNVIMTRARKPFDFFPETVLQVLDDGPIDVRAPGSKVADLQYALPFNKAVALFSGQAQFVIEDEKLLASSPPAIKEVTAFASTLDSPPVAAGRTVYFGSTRGNFTSVQEYYIQPETGTDTTDAVDVTRHVPTYVPKGLFKLASSASSDLMLAVTEDAPNLLYVYKYFWQEQNKLQSSWSYWEFDAGVRILNVDFINDVAFLVSQYDDGVYLESLDVSEGQTDPDAPYVILLDRRVSEAEVTTAYDSNLDRTTITVPYSPNPATVQVVSRFGEANDRTPATTAVVASVSGSDIVVEGDWTSSLFYAGQRYSFDYEFSRPVKRQRSSNGASIYEAGGRLQIGFWNIVFNKTGYFRVLVEPSKGGDTFVYKYTGKRLGTPSATIGTSSIGDGEFRFPVKGKSDRIRIRVINDSFLPCNLTSANWEGYFERKRQR